MGINIGDVFLGLRATPGTFKKDVVAESAAAGREGGRTLGEGLKRGFEAARDAGRQAFSAMVDRQREVTAAVAAFRAETGATADEAERAGRAINAMAGRNLQSIEEIGRTLTKVRTDLGLTGDAAERETERFLRFAQATGQDAADAVLDFDDILDAWGLTAEDSAGIMDVLIESHQLYGGSIEDNQRLLAALAPTLKAANMDWEEANGLLNLFARAGVGAEAAGTALNRALQKVESPEELQALIEDIAATEDEFERAQKAADLFGSRAGPKMAGALADSKGDLAAFRVTTRQAAGAMDEARDASITFADQLTLGIRDAVSTAAGLLGDGGPLLLAVSSLQSVLSPALSSAWTKLGGAAGLRTAVGAAGAVAGLVYSAAAAGGHLIANAVVGAWTAIGRPGSRVLAAATAAGASSGAAFAGAAGAGGFIGTVAAAVAGMAPLAIPAVIAIAAKPILDEQVQKLDIGQGTKDLITGAGITKENTRFSGEFRFPWEQGGFFHPDVIAEGVSGAVEQGMQAGAADIAADSQRHWGWVTGAMGSDAVPTAFQRIGGGAATMGQAAATAFQRIGGGAASAGERLDVHAAAAGRVRRATLDMAAATGIAVEGFKKERASLGDLIERADELADKRDNTKERLADLVQQEERLVRRQARALEDGNDRAVAAYQRAIEKNRDMQAELRATQQLAEELSRRPYVIDIKARALGIGAGTLAASIIGGHRQHGGPVYPGLAYWVGEAGRPELFVPDRPGRIVPDDQVRRGGGGADGGSAPPSIQVNAYGTPLRPLTPFEIVEQAERAARFGDFTPRRDVGWETG